jgi:hypothetical protein
VHQRHWRARRGKAFATTGRCSPRSGASSTRLTSSSARTEELRRSEDQRAAAAQRLRPLLADQGRRHDARREGALRLHVEQAAVALEAPHAGEEERAQAVPRLRALGECLEDNRGPGPRCGKYNVRDVVATEQLYLKLRPWIEGHPNVAAYSQLERVACPKCGGRDLQMRGRSLTQFGEYHRYQCKAAAAGLGLATRSTRSRSGSCCSPTDAARHAFCDHRLSAFCAAPAFRRRQARRVRNGVRHDRRGRAARVAASCRSSKPTSSIRVGWVAPLNPIMHVPCGRRLGRFVVHPKLASDDRDGCADRLAGGSGLLRPRVHAQSRRGVHRSLVGADWRPSSLAHEMVHVAELERTKGEGGHCWSRGDARRR